ncbi:MAG TPA: hypothetical protein VNX28_03760 [Gemmataceae bacterium]|nr:hypothetical protein [Gemmataceae bacterium]
MAVEAAKLSGKAMGVYFTLNDVDKSLLARRCNRVDVAESGDLTGDLHIIRLRWLLIDLDPERAKGISATDQEKAKAKDLAYKIRDFLHEEQSWPDPVFADSGNGHHLLYKIDLPTDDKSLIERFLKAMAGRFDTAEVKIDRTVFNPSRICKLYGTLSCKGDHTIDRPHRIAMVLEPNPITGGALTIVTREQIEELAGEAPPSPSPRDNARNSFHGGASTVEWMEAFIQRHNIRTKPAENVEGGKKWVLEVCPFNPEHGGDAAIFARETLGFKCFHNGCAGKDWHAFRVLYEAPGGSGARPQTTAPAPHVDAPTGLKGWEIIRNFFIATYDPTFRREGLIVSRSEGREMKRNELVDGAHPTLITRLAEAMDVPRDAPRQGEVVGPIIHGALPGFFKKWVPTAWEALYGGLPDEETGDEISDLEKDKFWKKVADALLSPVNFPVKRGDKDDVERRSIADQAAQEAIQGKWKQLRCFQLWMRRDGSRLRIAIRGGFFNQSGVNGGSLAGLLQNKITILAQNYGVGAATPVKGNRAIELSQEFLDDVFFTMPPPEAEEPAHDQPQPPPAPPPSTPPQAMGATPVTESEIRARTDFTCDPCGESARARNCVENEECTCTKEVPIVGSLNLLDGGESPSGP